MKTDMKKLFLFALLGLTAFAADAQITINEFLASNTVTNTDSAGDFDDWIELYNGGSNPVDIAGYYLTDDPLDLQKDQIPTGYPALTTIPAHGFLMIWCDEEGIQGPLHVNFKLGAGGEFIGISDSLMHIVDTLTFGAQNPDISYGRTPDGGSNWILYPVPTPDATNMGPVALALSQVAAPFRLFPNPATSTIGTTDGQPFHILDAIGQVVGTSDASGNAAISGLPAGIYIARGISGATVRFVKR